MKKIILPFVLLLLCITAICQNPLLLKDVYPGVTGSGIQQIVKTSNYTFFNAEDDDPDPDRGLYRTNGTPGGTIKLNLSYLPDPPPSPNNYLSTKAEKLTALGNKIIFAGDNFANYGEIWSSDGTQAGTIAIERFQPTAAGVSPIKELNKMGSFVYYSAVNSSNQAILKRTDGTVAGTSEVYNFGAYAGIPEVVFLTPVNDVLYFIVYDVAGTGVDQLWRSDGTTAGTYMVYNFGPNQYVASFIMPAGNNLYIMTVVPGTGNVLWKSDGTTAGSMNVKTIASSGNNNYPANVAIGSTLYFAGLDGNGKELWKTDGTAAGTVMVADINAGAASSNPFSMTVFNNNIYFAATTIAEGNELWKYNGIAASLVKDINAGNANSAPGSLVVSNNTIVFRATTLSNGGELWITDGTPINTVRVADINPGAPGSGPNILTPGNPVYFTANNGIIGGEIFKYDNTEGINGLNKIYVNDNSTTSDVFTTAIGNNTNTGTKAAPVATVSYALTIALAGDTIVVDAGTYTEQITIDKGIIIKGAGKNLTSILKPLTTVAPPGSFPEQGVIQTAQSITGDVHISNLSVTGDYTVNVTPIIIQGGGSVRNCNLQNGNQGIFVRIDPIINLATKTFVVDSNRINAEYIAVNFAGTRLTGTLSNNTLATFNPGFSTGVFAGLDFGALAGLTVTGNTFSSFVSDGLLVSTNNGIISQNSFLGTGPKAINNIGGATINATCNWYGSPLAATVVSKINGGVTYSPWLIDGTDINPAIGFQSSVPCPVANSYYVNDNSTTGDVFTTAVGNNVNAGTLNAPFATVDYAISQVPAGATIYVDAGTYALASALSVNKSITILGSNYLVSPNNATTKTIYNNSRNAESKIAGSALLIAANNIFIKGLRFAPTASAISQNGNYNRVIMDKNYFDVTGTGNIVNLQGSTGNPVVAFDYSITDSRFERTDILNGSSINLGWVKSLWIDNNVFIESPAFGNPYRGIGVRTVNGQSVEGLTFSNNYVKKLNVGVFPQIVQDLGVSNNVFDSCTTGYSQSPFGAVSNNIFIRTNTFTNTRVGRSILVRGSSNGGVSNFNVIDNIINQEVDGINGIVGMIQFDFAATSNNGSVLVQANKLNLSGNYNNAFFKTQCGIIIIGKHNNTTISYNELNFTAINQIFNPSTVIPSIPTGIFINTDGGTGSGPIPASSIINITNNKINGFKSSIGIYDPTPTGLTPDVGYGYLTNGASVNINNNSITGDSMLIDNGVLSQSVNASCNWYGSNVEENINPKISLATVKHIPWLSNGTDNDAATGFQPLPNSCNGYPRKLYVNDNIYTPGIDVFTTAVGSNTTIGTPGAPFATLDFAYSLAEPGDTIYVDAGTYTMADFTIAKEITILGTNYLTSPNNPANRLQLNPVRNAESTIAGATINLASSNISFQGLSFDPGNKVAMGLNFNVASAMNYGDFFLTRNRFKINSNLSQIILIGIGTATTSPSALINQGFNIQENRFEKNAPSTGVGNTFSIHNLKNLTINNNSFVVTAIDGSRIQSAIAIGNNGVVDNIVITNNLIDRHSNAITGNRFANALISHNTMSNCLRALNLVTTMPESSSVEFSNNIVESTTGGCGFIGSNRSGTSLPGTSTTLKVENNTFTGVPIPGLPNQLFGSMNFSVNNSIINPAFILRGNKINYTGDFSTIANELIRPITLRGNVANATLENNEIILINSGTLMPTNPALGLPTNPGITINTDFGSGAYMPANAIINILNNKVQGFKQSVVFYDATSTGINSYTGYGNIPAGATVNINNNSFTGDEISINSGEVGQTVNATCNWYGSSAEQNVSPKLTETTVNYIPWLTNGTDNDVAVGFQPVANSCNGIPVDVDIILVTNVTCNGAANGSIDAFVEEGVAPFTYAWSKDGIAGYSTTEDLSNLAPGLYELVVTDANGSTDTVFATITQPAPLTASANGTNNICFGASAGTASVTPGGGTLPYTYLWSNGATTGNISNLIAGIYSVTVTDANGCTTTGSYTVTQPNVLTALVSGTNVSCFGGSNGTASVNANGGTAPYTYLWNNVATTNSISGLVAGTYSVTVTDANGCTTTGSYTVTQPTILTSVVSGTNVSCFGGANGTAAVNATGGTAPYTYLWSNAATTNSISGLVAGTYSVTVTDANGCTITGSYTVTQPTLLTAVVSGTNVSCFGGSNGTALVNANGGTSPYTYLWSNAATTSSISGLVAGNYSVTVTDANGCTITGSSTVTQPTLLTAVATGTSTSCLNTASVAATGGTGSYTYLWSNGATTRIISSIPAGTYSVVVTDVNGCTATASVTVTANEAFNPAASVTNVSCFGGTNGKITVTNVNAIAPFSFSINGVNFLPGTLPYTFNNLAAGTYTIAVRDANGCTGFVTKTISQPTLLVVNLTSVQSTCYGQSTGAINVTASGGSGALSYSWAGPGGYSSSQSNISNLATGNYIITVTDNNGCTANLNIAVPSFNQITVSAAITNVLCRGASTGSINLTVSGGSNSGFSFAWSGGSTSTAEDLINLGAGNYNVTITDVGSGCVTTRSYSITQPATNLALSAAKTNATGCNSLGTITATGSGGTSPYQYKLDNGSYQNSGSFTGLYAGNYTTWVRDANGCTRSTVVSITDNGSDEYESNNSKNQAKAISISTAIYARIATAADAADWFKFTTPAGTGNYILSFAHPSATFTFNMYTAGNNTPPLVPINPTATSKEYVLNGNTTYYISVTGGLSYVCYTLMVAPPTSFAKINTPEIITTVKGNSTPIKKDKPVVIEVENLSVKAYPNPHKGVFNLRIESPENGIARIELFTITGQKLQERTVSIQKSGNNIVPFTVTQFGTILYRVSIGGKIITGKVLSMN